MLESWEYDLLQAEKERDEYISKLPKCDCCGMPIQSEYCYEIAGELICEDCLVEYRVETSKYADD